MPAPPARELRFAPKVDCATARLSLLAMVLLMMLTRVASWSEMPPPYAPEALSTMVLFRIRSWYQF